MALSITTGYLVGLYAQIALSVLLGYTLACILREAGILKVLEHKVRRSIGRFVHPSLTSVVLLYLVSPRAGHAHASSLLRRGEVSGTDVYIALLASGLSLRVMYLYRLYIPLLIPLLGKLAIFMILLRLMLDIATLLAVMLYGYRRYRGRRSLESATRPRVRLGLKELQRGFLEALHESARFLLRFTPLYILVSVMMLSGFMDEVSVWLAPPLKWLGASALGITCIVTCIASPRMGWGVARVMINAGHPTNEVLGCLFLGTGLFVLLNELWSRHLPLYASLYPKRAVINIIILRSIIPSIYNILLGILFLRL